MLLQLETTNQAFMNTNAYNSLYHTTLPEMACNEKVIMCGFKPLQVFNRLVIINSQLSFFILNTCVFGTCLLQQQQHLLHPCTVIFPSLWTQQSCKWCFNFLTEVVEASFLNYQQVTIIQEGIAQWKRLLLFLSASWLPYQAQRRVEGMLGKVRFRNSKSKC